MWSKTKFDCHITLSGLNYSKYTLLEGSQGNVKRFCFSLSGAIKTVLTSIDFSQQSFRSLGNL